MKGKLKTAKIDVKELAERLGVTRTTVYNYIARYPDNSQSIPDNVRAFFDALSSEDRLNQDVGRALLAEFFPTELETLHKETDKALEYVIEDFCSEKQTEYNFMPIVLPTGARKTSSVVSFIAKYIKEGGKNNILFVTTLKKNLPVSEISEEDKLRRSFEEYGIGNLYDDKVLVVDSLSNMLKDNYSDLSSLDKTQLRMTMGDSIADELNTYIRSMAEASSSKFAYNEIFEKFRVFESGFRFHIAKNLKFLSKDPVVRKSMVTDQIQWKWVSILYPTVYTSDRQVFLMSMDKFISSHDTIVDGRYSIYDSKMIDDAIIFIDEFDATKTTVMNNIIRSDKGNLDYAGIFKRIYRTLEHNEDIWKEYYRAFDDESESGKTTLELINELYASAKSIAEEYALELDFKMDDNSPDTFLFRDNRIVKAGNNNRYHIESDQKDRINRIVCVKGGDTADENSTEGEDGEQAETNTKSISTMLGRMYKMFRFFEGIMFKLSMNHYLIQSSEGKSITRDEAIRTVLDPYDFNEEQTNYLVNAIKFRTPRRRNNSDRTPDYSFYSMGFEVFNFVDDTSHNLSTKLYCKSIKRTPEKMLMIVLDPSHNAKVIGISATAMIPTVVGNYDFRYLRSQKAFKEYKIDPEDRERMRSMFKKAIDRYDRVDIVTSLIPAGYMPFHLINNPMVADEFNQRMEEIGKDEPYKVERYMRVLAVYHKFLRTHDLRSMLCFMNLFPKAAGARNDMDFSENLLRDILSVMVDEYLGELNELDAVVPEYMAKLKEQPFVILRSNDYDANKKELIDRLSNGEKIFVFTTYLTVGAGQNLQYPIPDDVLPRIQFISSLADPAEVKSMDFNGIYLDMPTNIVSNVEINDDESLLRALFNIEAMQENNEMDYKEAKREVDVAFKNYFGLTAYSAKKGLSFASYRMAGARLIIQAVGRICRTFAKNSNIYIMADDNLGKIFNGTSLRDYADPEDNTCDYEDIMVNPEFRALFNLLQTSSFKVGVTVDKGKLSNECVKAHAYIDSMIMSKVWSSNSMASWKAVRQYVLRFPTLPKDAKLDLVYNMYTKLPEAADKIRYSQEKDFKFVQISESGEYEVSANDARLDDLMKIQCVSKLFGPPMFVDFESVPSEEELASIPFANSFAKNTAIMCPTLYHNIYKGALGEAVGTAIFNDWGLEISEILDADKFERFDATVGQDIYVDFKHWAGKSKQDNIKLIKKSFGKLREIGGRVAIIINILKPKEGGMDYGYTLDGKDYSDEKRDYSGLKIVTIPYLYDCNGDTAILNMDSKKAIAEAMKL